MAAIEGHDGSRPITLGQDHVRSVRDADVLAGIPLDHGGSLEDLLDLDPGQVPGTAGQLAQDGRLGRDAEPGCHEVVESATTYGETTSGSVAPSRTAETAS